MNLKTIQLIIIFLEFNFFYMQSHNELNSLICGAGIYDPPTLIQYQNSISKESQFNPIRIFIDFTSLNESFSNPKFGDINNSKELIVVSLAKAVYLMEQIINIKRYSENLYLTQDIINSLGIGLYSQKLLTGIPFDLIIYPRISEKRTVNLYSEKRTINFYGYPIVVDKSTKRPIFGFLNIFNLNYKIMSNLETYFINSFIHQLIHIMVFDPNLIKTFPNYSSPQYRFGKDVSLSTSYFIISPKVIAFAKRHFNCQYIDGMKLDFSTHTIVTNYNNLLYHWDQRYMLGDIMTIENYEEQTISEITLALFEDSNWYKVNYYTGGLFRYGKGETCIFIKYKCVNTLFIYSAFCPEDKEGEQRCTAGRLQKGICRFYSYTSPLTEYYQYYPTNLTKGGKPTNYFCPVAEKQKTSKYINNFAPGSCLNGIISSELGEKASSNSFCTVSNIAPIYAPVYSYQARAACYSMHCSETTLTIQIEKLFFVCPTYGGVIGGYNKYGYIGDMECPDYNVICTGSVMCNNIQDCIEKKSVYKENTFTYKEVTHIYQDLTSALNDVHVKNQGEQSEDGKCGLNCILCSIDNSCLICSNGYTLGSKLIDRNNKHYLFCDSSSNFKKNEFVLDNGIYYPLRNLVEPTTTTTLIENSKTFINMSLFILKIVIIFSLII